MRTPLLAVYECAGEPCTSCKVTIMAQNTVSMMDIIVGYKLSEWWR